MITLTPLLPEHIPVYVKWWDNPAFSVFLETKSLTEKAAFEYMQDPKKDCYSIQMDNNHAGNLMVQPSKSVSIVIAPELWGYGIATEALRQMKNSYPFLTAGIYLQNKGCLIAFLKAGFIIGSVQNGIVKMVWGEM